jgi:hypothetical protein
MLMNGANQFFFSLWPTPSGHTALTLGESGRSMTWDSLFVNPNGLTSRGQFMAALIPLAQGEPVKKIIGRISYAKARLSAVALASLKP